MMIRMLPLLVVVLVGCQKSDSAMNTRHLQVDSISTKNLTIVDAEGKPRINLGVSDSMSKIQLLDDGGCAGITLVGKGNEWGIQMMDNEGAGGMHLVLTHYNCPAILLTRKGVEYGIAFGQDGKPRLFQGGRVNRCGLLFNVEGQRKLELRGENDNVLWDSTSGSH